jgi:hypothetical protein
MVYLETKNDITQFSPGDIKLKITGSVPKTLPGKLLIFEKNTAECGIIISN